MSIPHNTVINMDNVMLVVYVYVIDNIQGKRHFANNGPPEDTVMVTDCLVPMLLSTIKS